MRHQKAGYKLGRNASHRHALMRNLARALFEHGRIITTVPKAKAVRPFAEKLITLAKKGTLHARRLAIARLQDKEMVAKLFNEIGPRFADRPGGYTRIIKRHERRLGDAGRTAFIELLREGETKAPRRAPAPAPRIEPVPAPHFAPPSPTAPAPTTPPAPEATSTPTAGSAPEGAAGTPSPTTPPAAQPPEGSQTPPPASPDA